jgi:EmrB/QacA subfamily drug resistance transporter
LANVTPASGQSRAGRPAAGRKWGTLAAVCTALFVVAVNTTAVNTLLPAIADFLHASVASLAWVVSIYLLVAAAFIVTGGELGDLLGRRKIFLLGIALYAVASVVIASAPAEWVVILGRGLQGLGAAIITPGSLALIDVAFPEEEQGTAIGVWGAIAGLGFALGPLLGGFLTEVVSWQGLFWFNLPVLAVAAGLTRWAAAESRDELAPHAVDAAGIALFAGGMFVLVLALNWAPTAGWGSPRVLALFAAAAVLLGLFTGLEPRLRCPLVHFARFRSPPFVGANIATFVLMWILIATLYYFNLYVQHPLLLNLSPVRAAVAVLPLNLAMFLLSLSSGRILGRFGARRTIATGMVLMAAGCFLLSRVAVETTYAGLWVPLVLVGLGLGLTFSPASAAAVRAVPREHAGEASGLNNMSRYLGATIGIALTIAFYTDAARAALNGALAQVGVPAAGQRHLDQVLTSAESAMQTTLAQLDAPVRVAFTAGAREAAVAMFSIAMLIAAIVAGLGAVSTLALLRAHRTPAAPRHEAPGH